MITDEIVSRWKRAINNRAMAAGPIRCNQQYYADLLLYNIMCGSFMSTCNVIDDAVIQSLCMFLETAIYKMVALIYYEKYEESH